MATAAWTLGGDAFRHPDVDRKHLAVTALFMIAPWMLFSIFAGMGAPPSTAAGWAATGTEQQIRYYLLILGGVLLSCGMVLLKDRLKKAGEPIYSQLGFIILIIAIPLFLINMAFWGNYLVAAFKIFVASGASAKRPDWFAPLNELFYAISVVEIALFYLATAAFAASLKIAGLIRPGVSRIYIVLSMVGFVLNILSYSVPEPFATASYLVSVPAIPFIMPYLMGVHLLRRAGSR